jgi:hypothetical protein
LCLRRIKVRIELTICCPLLSRRECCVPVVVFRLADPKSLRPGRRTRFEIALGPPIDADGDYDHCMCWSNYSLRLSIASDNESVKILLADFYGPRLEQHSEVMRWIESD